MRRPIGPSAVRAPDARDEPRHSRAPARGTPNPRELLELRDRPELPSAPVAVLRRPPEQPVDLPRTILVVGHQRRDHVPRDLHREFAVLLHRSGPPEMRPVRPPRLHHARHRPRHLLGRVSEQQLDLHLGRQGHRETLPDLAIAAELLGMRHELQPVPIFEQLHTREQDHHLQHPSLRHHRRRILHKEPYLELV